MTRFDALLVDDEPLAIETLEGLCERDGRARVVGSARDGESALARVAELQPDVVFLDIGMPGLNGLQIAAALGALPAPPVIVFVTAYDHHAAEAFDLAVTDYVLKPVQSDRFRRAIDRVIEVIEQRRIVPPACAEDLWLPRRGTVVRVPIASVVRVEADRDYAKVFTAEESFFVRTTMTSIEKRLSPGRFMRIHRSTIVAIDDVVSCRHAGNGSWRLLDRRGSHHAIGRRHLDEVRRALGVGSSSPA